MYSELIQNDIFDQEFDNFQQWCRDGKNQDSIDYSGYLKKFKWPNLYAVTVHRGWNEDDWKAGFSASQAWFIEEPGDDEKIKMWLALEGYTNIERVLA